MDSQAKASKATGKTTKLHKKIVVLRLSSDVLSNFPRSPAPTIRLNQDASPTRAVDVKPVESQNGYASDANDTTIPPPSSGNATPAPNGDDSNPTGKAGAKGVKRGADAAGLKQKGKPGPKKRKVDGEPPAKGPGATGTAPAHKLGPKANQGIINANLRALDRTKKSTRNWHRSGFQLKSFTGVSWQMPCWNSAQPQNFNPDSKSGSTGSSEMKPEQPHSGAESEKSLNGAGAVTPTLPTDIASSPAPTVQHEVSVAS